MYDRSCFNCGIDYDVDDSDAYYNEFYCSSGCEGDEAEDEVEELHVRSDSDYPTT